MPSYAYRVTVTAATEQQANQVMAERLQPDEDYGFDYTVDYDQPEDLAEFRAEHPDRTGPRQAESRYAGVLVDDGWEADVKAGISPDRALRLMYRRQANTFTPCLEAGDHLPHTTHAIEECPTQKLPE